MRQFVVVLWASALAACGGDGTNGGSEVVGETAVDLELTERLTRNQEAPIGNLVADAYLAAFDGAQAALVNGGSLRCPSEFDAVQCEDFKIPAGEITEADLEIVLAFNSSLVVKEIAGTVLRSTLERSVATIPSVRKGWFLHPAGLTYSADCSRTAQQLDAEDSAVVTEGDRITEIRVGGALIDDAATYSIVVNSFVGAGNDGHILLGEAPGQGSEVRERDALRALLLAQSPVSPAVEGRVSLSSDCVSD
jgi:5'-nucleotidase / UDP-sugar diphosphatase